MDSMTPEERSRCMAAVKSNDTKPEMIVRRYLHAKGFRYGIHNHKLPGSPDIVLRKYKTVIFVNGCFWHGHENCKYFRLPKSNADFWNAKIKRNVARDEKTAKELEAKGWRVIVIWECELKNKMLQQQSLKRIADQIIHYMEKPDNVDIAAEPETEYK